MTWGYLIIWEFCPKAGCERRFEEVYGSNGIWARFFRQDQEFIGTELVRDFTVARRYLSLDFCREAYEQFRMRHANQPLTRSATRSLSGREKLEDSSGSGPELTARLRSSRFGSLTRESLLEEACRRAG